MTVKEALRQAGALAVGVAEADAVPDFAFEAFRAWLNAHHEAGMAYMRNHMEIRRDPRLLLEGARSVISMAFPYGAGGRAPQLPRISAYALIPDYHDEIRRRIRASQVSDILGEEGRDWRICVDSAPIMERYWAQKAGVGVIGDNGMLIVPGHGNRVFLAEIVTTALLSPDRPMCALPGAGDGCGHCGLCGKACPTGALMQGGIIDCDSCISYLTIEHRGEWNDPRHLAAMHTPAGRRTLFGCDRCAEACPHNRAGDSCAPVAEPLSAIENITAQDIMSLPHDQLAVCLRGSALKRAKRDGLLRNALNASDASGVGGLSEPPTHG